MVYKVPIYYNVMILLDNLIIYIMLVHLMEGMIYVWILNVMFKMNITIPLMKMYIIVGKSAKMVI